MGLMKESVILIGICLADLLATLFLMANHGAREGNPVMDYYLRAGTGAFVLAKLALLFLPIFIAEWCRQFKPRFVQRILQLAIVGYVGVYLTFFIGVNYQAFAARNVEVPKTPTVVLGK